MDKERDCFVAPLLSASRKDVPSPRFRHADVSLRDQWRVQNHVNTLYPRVEHPGWLAVGVFALTWLIVLFVPIIALAACMRLVWDWVWRFRHFSAFNQKANVFWSASAGRWHVTPYLTLAIEDMGGETDYSLEFGFLDRWFSISLTIDSLTKGTSETLAPARDKAGGDCHALQARNDVDLVTDEFSALDVKLDAIDAYAALNEEEGVEMIISICREYMQKSWVKDRFFIQEIINDLYRSGHPLPDKAMTLLHDWSRELAVTTELRGKTKREFFKQVGKENW